MQFLWTLIGYLASSFAMYTLFNKAGVENAWFAFIPVLNLIPFFHVINKSAWNIFWFLVPIANAVFLIIWYVKFLKAYGRNPWMVLVMFIPAVNYIYLLYLAFSASVQYEGEVYQG